MSSQTEGVQYTFEIRAHTYSNPQHQIFNGNDCRTRNRDCMNEFQFCLTAPDVPLLDTDDCRLGIYQFQENSDDITFLTGSAIVPGETVPNPMTFNTATGPWPVSAVSYSCWSKIDNVIVLVTRCIHHCVYFIIIQLQ